MARCKNKRYVPKTFESAKPNHDTSANIYHSMLESDAWHDLNTQEQVMYVCMKDQYYGKRKPQKDFPDLEILDDKCFYFPRNLCEKYGLPKNKANFYKRIRTLEEHGFIKTVVKGKPNHSKSIYQYSSDWKYWKKQDLDETDVTKL